MNILITGGAGFIGSHLAEALLEAGHRVHIIDDLSTGSVRNIEAIRKNPAFSYDLESIFNEKILRESVDRADVIYHLAAAVGVQLIIDKPTHTIRTNVKGTELVLEYASLKNKRVFIASTSEVYGKNPAVPFTEESDLLLGPTTKPRWAYACSKAIDEFLALACHRESGLPVTIVRFFNTVGARQTGRYGMVIPRFVAKALAGEPLPVYGDGLQSRCFADVSDVIWALLELLKHESSIGKVFNIGNPEEVSILDLAKKVIAKTGSSSRIELISFDQAMGADFEDMQRRIPAIERLVKLTGFKPKVNLDGILERIIAWQKETKQT